MPNRKGAEQPRTINAQLNAPISQDEALHTSAPVTPSTTNDDRWHFLSYRYLWFPGMHGTVGARNYETSVHVSAVDILEHFNIGLMRTVEAQYNRWGFPFEYVWVKLSDHKALIIFPDYSVKATVKEGFFTPKATYLVVDNEKVQIRLPQAYASGI